MEMAVMAVHGSILISAKAQSASHDISLSSSLLGQKVDHGHSSSSITGFQLGKMNCPKQMPKTTRRLVTSSILADVAKEFMNFHAPRIITPKADPKTVASIILGGGAGTRLFPLTRRRAKPANVEEADRPSQGFYIRSGITVVLKNSVIADGTII